MKFGMTEEHFELLKRLVILPLIERGAKVWIFGSRANGKFKEFSDVDILFEFDADAEKPKGLIFKIKDDLEESRFPYKLDLVDRSSLAESYRAVVEQEKIKI
jgi:uncharacterized protein